MGDRRLIYLGLALLAAGLLLTALTPRQPVPGYSRQELLFELSKARRIPGENPPTQHLQISLPDDSRSGWLGLGWLMLAILPARDIGGMLGMSAAFLSAGNALAPLIGGRCFKGWARPRRSWLGDC